MIEYILVLLASILLLGIIVMIPVFKVVSAKYPYSSLQARLRVMRKKLLGADDFERLMDAEYTDIVYRLDKTVYPGLRELFGPDTSYAAVDSALRTKVVRDLLRVRTFSPPEVKGFVTALLRKYDILMIESIIRSSSFHDAARRDIMGITEVFSEDYINRGDFSYESLMTELKGTKYSAILEKHADSIKGGRYKELEEELDMYYFQKLLSAATTTLTRSYVKKMIDIQNISLVLKGENAKIPGGVIALESFSNDVVKVAGEHGYKLAGETPAEIERSAEKLVYDFGISCFSKDPLSDAPLVGYIVQSRTCARNANILLKLKSKGLTKEAIKEVLVL